MRLMERKHKLRNGVVAAFKCTDTDYHNFLKTEIAQHNLVGSVVKFLPGFYTEIMSVPLDEFVYPVKYHEKVAGWFFEKSRGPSWADRGIACLSHGDVITINKQPMMYVRQGAFFSITLPDATDYAIINLDGGS